jgi:Flp pilus assembly protein TadG
MKNGSKRDASTLIEGSLKRRSPVVQRRCRRTQRAQSLVEMAIALLVLIPLAAGVMLLGQYIHIKQQTQAAARAAAWDATVSPEVADRGMPDQAQVLKKLRARQFSRTRTVITSAPQDAGALGDPMLTTFANQELPKPSGVELMIYSQGEGPGIFDRALGSLKKVSNTLPPNPGSVAIRVEVRHLAVWTAGVIQGLAGSCLSLPPIR